MLLPISVVLVSAWLALTLFGNSDRQNAESLRDFVIHDFPVTQNIHIRVADIGLRFPDLVEAAQAQLNHRLSEEKIPFKYELVDELPRKVKKPKNLLWEPADMVLTVDATETDTGKGTETETSLHTLDLEGQESENSTEGDANNTKIDLELSNSSLLANFTRVAPLWVVELAHTDKLSVLVDIHEPKATLTYNLESVFTNDLPFYLTQAIFDSLLLAELEMWRNVQFGQFQYQSALKVNFIAAEELGNTPKELKDEIEKQMKYLESKISPYVQITHKFSTVDITKQRIPKQYTNNSTSLNFVYLTSLSGIINSVQGIQLYHIAENEEIEGEGGNEKEKTEGLTLSGHNSTQFLTDIETEIKLALRIPDFELENLNLAVESIMKNSAISGIVAVLDDLLKSTEFDKVKFAEVTKLVDAILKEKQHDWSAWLKQVNEIYMS